MEARVSSMSEIVTRWVIPTLHPGEYWTAHPSEAEHSPSAIERLRVHPGGNPERTPISALKFLTRVPRRVKSWKGRGLGECSVN